MGLIGFEPSMLRVASLEEVHTREREREREREGLSFSSDVRKNTYLFFFEIWLLLITILNITIA